MTKIIDGIEVENGGYVLFDKYLEDSEYGVTTIEELEEDLFMNKGFETDEEIQAEVQEIVKKFESWCRERNLSPYYGS